MGFSHDPGPLPFITVRPRDKWGPRVVGQAMIELQCDRGGFEVAPRARIVKVEDYTGPVPGHLSTLYKGLPLIAIHLAPYDG